MEQKIDDFEQELARKFQDLMSNGGGGNVKVITNNVDPHKLC